MTTLREQIAEWQNQGKFCRVGNRQRRIADVVDWEIGGMGYGDLVVITIWSPYREDMPLVLAMTMTETGLKWSVDDFQYGTRQWWCGVCKTGHKLNTACPDTGEVR